MLNSSTQEIKSKIDIVDIISEYIQLKPAGTHNLRALCPFHNEKTPSFMVSRDKQFWYCFGCAKGGDVFSFVQEHEGMSFPEALHHLADRVGVKITKQNPKLINEKTRVLDVLSLVTQFYQEYLNKKPEAQIARDYLTKRQVKMETADHFKIGYAPDSWDITKNFLKQKGYTEKEIFLAGLLSKKDDQTNRTYDRFRGRLIFPVFDHNGVVIGFSARALKKNEEKSAKYINSPQTIVYDKSQVLYGLNYAKQDIKKEDLTVVVEGQLDVVSSHQAGVNNVVASSGTALTEQQLVLLKRYSNNIALCFDADLAGENAAKRGIEIALSKNLNIQIITIPEGKDPDECIKNSLLDWKQAIGNAEEFMQYFFKKILKPLDLKQVKDKKIVAKEMLLMIKKISDVIEKSFWLRKLADKLDVDEDILRDKLKEVKVQQSPNISPVIIKKELPRKSQLDIKKTREEVLSEKLIAMILVQPPLLEIANRHLRLEMITGVNNQNLYKNLIIYYTETVNTANQETISLEQYLSNKGEDIIMAYKVLELLASKEYEEMDFDEIKKESINFIDNIKENYLLNKRRELQKEMEEAENKGNKKLIESLSKEFNSLI